MTTLTHTSPRAGRLGFKRLLIAGLAGGALAAGVNTALLLTGKAAGVAFLAPINGPDLALQVSNHST